MTPKERDAREVRRLHLKQLRERLRQANEKAASLREDALVIQQQRDVAQEEVALWHSVFMSLFPSAKACDPSALRLRVKLLRLEAEAKGE